MKVIWTIEQVAGLAPTNHLLKTSRSFAFAEKWLTLGQNGQTAWGIFPLSKEKAPIQTSVTLTDLHFSCSCASRSFPCAHGLGLLQLIIGQPTSFALSGAPDWVVNWQQDVLKRIDLQRRRDTAVPPPHHQQKRHTVIQTGLTELELWLHDLVRNGLVAARRKPKKYWFAMADRMVDAKAPGIAVELRQLAAVPTDDADWAETILRRIGRLYLLIQGFQQFDMLAPEVQADLYTAVSRQTRNTALMDAPGIRDKWHILGQETDQSGRRYIQHIWLWGEQSNRAAQISRIAHSQRHKTFNLVTGTVLDAKLQFYLGTSPLRAQIIEQYGASLPKNDVIGHASIQAALGDFSQAVAANPWFKQFPMLITAVPIHNYSHWHIQDESGANLLLPTHYKQGWHLLALSRGRPLPIFGLFDGRTLTPLSVWHDGRVLSLHILRDVS